MSKMDTLKEILEENLDIDPTTVDEESTFESLGVDSLYMLEIITELEDRLDVDFGEPEGLENVGDLLDLIERLTH